MRTRSQLILALLPPLLMGSVRFVIDDEAAEPARFYREYVGLNEGQIREIRQGKAIAKILESRTPDEVFVFGSVYIDSTPENYVKFAADIDSLRKLPSYLAIR